MDVKRGQGTEAGHVLTMGSSHQDYTHTHTLTLSFLSRRYVPSSTGPLTNQHTGSPGMTIYGASQIWPDPYMAMHYW